MPYTSARRLFQIIQKSSSTSRPSGQCLIITLPTYTDEVDQRAAPRPVHRCDLVNVRPGCTFWDPSTNASIDPMAAILSKPITEIKEEDLQDLIENRVAERRQLDYKQALPGRRDADKKEYLADVTSFANTHGGLILYGLTESEGVPVAMDGIPDINPDAETLRMQSIVSDGVAPRISGHDTHALTLHNGNHVIIERIPDSWQKPHMVTFSGSQRFFARNTGGKDPMDINELRTTFNLSGSVVERIREFRRSRLNDVINASLPVRVEGDTKFVLHIIPVSAFASSEQIDLSRAVTERELMGPITGGSEIPRYNLDGIITASGGEEKDGYLAVHRNGIIEAVDGYLATPMNPQYKGTIAAQYATKHLSSAIGRYLKLLQSLSVTPPIIIMLSMTGIEGVRLLISEHYRSPAAADRPIAELPELVLESYPSDLYGELRSMFDMLWNVFGLERCGCYDEDGKWNLV